MSARDDILAAVAAEVRRGDDSAFRVTTIAQAAGCAPSVLYHYFGSRDGLIDAGYGELAREEIAAHELYARAAFDAAERATDVGGFVTDLAAMSLSTHRHESRIQRARLLGASQTRPAVRHAFQAYGEQVAATNRAVARRLQDRGLVRTDVDVAAVALVMRLVEDGWITVEVDDVPPVTTDAWLQIVAAMGRALAPDATH